MADGVANRVRWVISRAIFEVSWLFLMVKKTKNINKRKRKVLLFFAPLFYGSAMPILPQRCVW
jgi:hypothetical protein